MPTKDIRTDFLGNTLDKISTSFDKVMRDQDIIPWRGLLIRAVLPYVHDNKKDDVSEYLRKALNISANEHAPNSVIWGKALSLAKIVNPFTTVKMIVDNLISASSMAIDKLSSLITGKHIMNTPSSTPARVIKGFINFIPMAASALLTPLANLDLLANDIGIKFFGKQDKTLPESKPLLSANDDSSLVDDNHFTSSTTRMMSAGLTIDDPSKKAVVATTIQSDDKFLNAAGELAKAVKNLSDAATKPVPSTDSKDNEPRSHRLGGG